SLRSKVDSPSPCNVLDVLYIHGRKAFDQIIGYHVDIIIVLFQDRITLGVSLSQRHRDAG
ncbi:MAG: hypothetical protein P4L43_08645, partial [Syntrophobacteraceae bacterium]|nr:hypothetical protein [Syntrophobacteraceae bacterium]